MDLNREYAAHQKALMRADHAANDDDRSQHLAEASTIAGRISLFQNRLGAAASCAWSMAQMSSVSRI